MATRITRVGNTLTVEIPEDLAAQARIGPGDPVEWLPGANGGLALVKSGSRGDKKPADMSLEELLEGINEGDSLGEYGWGAPRGVEVW